MHIELAADEELGLILGWDAALGQLTECRHGGASPENDMAICLSRVPVCIPYGV